MPVDQDYMANHASWETRLRPRRGYISNDYAPGGHAFVMDVRDKRHAEEWPGFVGDGQWDYGVGLEIEE